MVAAIEDRCGVGDVAVGLAETDGATELDLEGVIVGDLLGVGVRVGI